MVRSLSRISLFSRLLSFCRLYTKMFHLAAVFALSLALQSVFKLRWYVYPLNLLGLYLTSGGWKFARLIWLTFGRDLRAAIVMVSLKRYMRKQIKEKTTVGEMFHQICMKQPNQTAIIDAETGAHLTFAEMEEKANQVAHIFKQNGYKEGDTVALMLDGCPEYVCYWIGLSKIGVISSLLNYSLRGDPLAHCINIVSAKAIIYGSVYCDAIADIKSKFDDSMEYYNADGTDTKLMTYCLRELMLTAPKTDIPKPDGVDCSSKLVYIYTSGTTGLPKAATIRHIRCLYLGYAVGTIFNTTPKDVAYISLPLYHSNGGLVGIGNCLFRGVPCVIRKKFSASRFVDDCIKYNVTAFVYIGEICRYLLAQPERPEDKKMNVRVIFGNGLRPQIWREFQSRFNIKKVGEFYGATESNAGMVNMDGKVGAVGFSSILAPNILPLFLVQVDPLTGALCRGRDGLAVRCKFGEPGELVCKINNDDPMKSYDGYANKEATQKKIARDVLNKGDCYFLTGDILVQDQLGYFYFLDRTGDTFRWKGENVSTAEVESTISNIIQLVDVVAYGVQVPGAEGKAGMVAIVDPGRKLDLKKLADSLKMALPSYARPLFIRLTEGISFTSTFKFKKVELRKEGFDLTLVGDDDLYLLNGKTGYYDKMDNELYTKVINNEIRF